MKLIKNLIAWIKHLFKRDKNVINSIKPPVEIINYKLTTTRERSSNKKLDIPSTQTVKSYSRSFQRIEDHKIALMKRKHLQTREIKEVIDSKGNVSLQQIQKPYTKSDYKTLSDYRRYVNGLNYRTNR